MNKEDLLNSCESFLSSIDKQGFSSLRVTRIDGAMFSIEVLEVSKE